MLQSAETTDRQLSHLPDLSNWSVPGSRFVRRAVSLTLAVVGSLLVTLVALSMVVSVNVTISGAGALEPASTWPVRSRESGVLSRLFVESLDTVEAGQILGQVDQMQTEARVADLVARSVDVRLDIKRLMLGGPASRRRFASELVLARASVSRAQAMLRQRMADFGVFGDVDSVAAAASSRVHAALDVASADLVSAKASLAAAIADSLEASLAEVDLEKKRAELEHLNAQLAIAKGRAANQWIVSPASGVLLTEDVDRLAGTFVNAGDLLFEVADVDHWHVRLFVNERDVHRVRIGDRTEVEVPALTRSHVDRVQGRVRSVGAQLMSRAEQENARLSGLSTGATGYRVLVELDSSVAALGKGVLRRGYTARGRIVTRRARLFQLAMDNLRSRVNGIAR
ncbi:MAG: HlyD family secretion protein [Pseudomonadota bacterium]|jgi:multidrug resistance efflux pump